MNTRLRLGASTLIACTTLSTIACTGSTEPVDSPAPEVAAGTNHLATLPTLTTYIDLRLDETSFQIAYGNGSPGSSNLTSVTVPVDPATRTAYSKSAPLALPCDVTGVLGGLGVYYQDAWKVAPPGTFVYPTKLPVQPHVWPFMNEALYLDGNPATPIHSNGWNGIQTPYGGFSQIGGNLYEMSDNHTVPQRAGFFTVDSNEPNYNFWSLYTPSDLPIDQPFLLHFWITDYTCSTFAASCLYADKNPVDNAIDVWLNKPSCH